MFIQLTNCDGTKQLINVNHIGSVFVASRMSQGQKQNVTRICMAYWNDEAIYDVLEDFDTVAKFLPPAPVLLS